MRDVTVIVPTRQEAENVTALATRVTAVLARSPLDWELVFVDDSDDETVAVLAGLAAARPPVSVVHRPPADRMGGLSGAVLAGLAGTSSRWVAVMDADLQHPPETLVALLHPLMAREADVAVASRYCPGGSPGGLSGPWRTAVSAGARAAVRTVFPQLRSVSDPLGGFFAFDRVVVDGVGLRPEGFKILLEVLVRGRWSQVAEVPFAFAARRDGRSKAGVREGMRFVRHVGRLWMAGGETGLGGPGAVPVGLSQSAA